MSAAFIDQSRTSKFARSKEPAPPANQANRRLLCSTFLGVTCPYIPGAKAPLFRRSAALHSNRHSQALRPLRTLQQRSGYLASSGTYRRSFRSRRKARSSRVLSLTTLSRSRMSLVRHRLGRWTGLKEATRS
jgi:hypothetical protein